MLLFYFKSLQISIKAATKAQRLKVALRKNERKRSLNLISSLCPFAP
jgi:hypothetical protein